MNTSSGSAFPTRLSLARVGWNWGLGKPDFTNAALRRFNENLVLDYLDVGM